MLRQISRFVRGTIAVAGLAIVAATPAAAQTITYSFTGFGTGTLNGVAFTQRSFAFTMSTPTAAVSETRFGAGVPSVSGLTASFIIAGTSGGTISGLYAFNNKTVRTVGFGSETNSDLLNLNGLAGLATYGMITNYGPQTATGSALFFGQFVNQETSAGALTFSNVSTATFQATVDGNVVPEPSTYLLLSTGLLVMAVVVRRRRIRN